MSKVFIQNREISEKQKPFIVAEMSGNHNQSLEKALAIVEAAKEAGADAIKLQTYTPDTMTLNLKKEDFTIKDSKSLWSNQSLYELYEKAHTPWEWHEPIFKRCEELGLIGFSSPFDETAINFLETLNVPCYKIASFENRDLPLIKRAAKTGKPLIISTGMATVSEIEEAVNTARNAGCKELILLKCTSTYPASPENTNINTIPHMKELFQCQVGLSDHTFGTGVAVASVALGATFIEKHVTLSRAEGGVDAAFSLEPNELKSLVEETERAWQSLGQIHYGLTEGEKKSEQFRRSIYIVKDMKKGEQLTEENLRIIRPGFGLAPKYYDLLLGKKVVKDVEKGTPMTFDLI